MITIVTRSCDEELFFKGRFNELVACYGHPSAKTCCPPSSSLFHPWSFSSCELLGPVCITVGHTGTRSHCRPRRDGDALKLPSSAWAIPAAILTYYAKPYCPQQLHNKISYLLGLRSDFPRNFQVPEKQDAWKAKSPRLLGGIFVPQVSKSNYKTPNLNIAYSHSSA